MFADAFLRCLSPLSYRQYLIRPYGAPSPRGEGFVRRYSFSTYACICSDVTGKAVFSYRSLPHGEGGPRQRCSGALVNRLLETHFPTLFHTASALSAPTGHLSLEGKAE